MNTLDHYDLRAIFAANDLKKVMIANKMRRAYGSDYRFSAVSKNLSNLPVKVS